MEACSTFDESTENERFRELRTTFPYISQKRKEEDDSKGVLPSTVRFEGKLKLQVTPKFITQF
jgi:hypothetical protein